MMKHSLVGEPGVILFVKTNFRDMKFIIILLLVFHCIACCNSLDIKQDYNFTLETMPVPTKIQYKETVEIRCKIIRDGKFDNTKFYIRYFQTDGKGILKLKDLTFIPNDLYLLSNDTFRLYFTSQCADQQKIDIYIEDNFGQVVQKSFSFLAVD